MRKINILIISILLAWLAFIFVGVSPALAQNEEATSESQEWWQSESAWWWEEWWTCDWPDENYIILNTNVPFVGRCIEKVFTTNGWWTTVANVFPKLMGNMIRIVMVILVVWWFLGILIWGFMIASNWAFGTKQTWVKLILGVIAGLILLWASGILLNLINPNFFGTASWP